MAKYGGKHYRFFMFYHAKAQSAHWQQHIERIRQSDPVYLLTRANNKWLLKIPVIQFGELRHVSMKSLSQCELFNVHGRKRKGFTWEEIQELLHDLRATWGDYPLHAKTGHNPDGTIITEDITGEDELIIHLKYMGA
jgi:hypothetical protein